MEDRIPPPVVEAARNRESGALAAVCEKLYPRIYRYLSYKVGDVRDAEDLAGEVFVKMLEAIPGQTGNFEAWLFRIAGNVLTDHYRLRFIMGYEHGEVAEIMGRSAGAIRALQFRALSALKDALGERI